MLPSLLYSTYKQYKEDTNYLAEWLAQAAKSRGYAFATPKSTTTSTLKLIPKKKIKNKKKALQAEQELHAQSTPHAVSTKELLSLAQFVSKCKKPQVNIPSSIISTIKRTIKARQHSNTYYSAVEPDSDGNDSHAYFISTLESILEVLGPAAAPKTQPKDKLRHRKDTTVPQEDQDESQSDDPPVASLGEYVQEPPASSKSSVQPQPTHNEQPQFTADTLVEEEKLSFAVACLFKDVQEIVRHVSTIWESYGKGDMDLVSASVASQCTLYLIKRLESDFFEDFTSIPDYEHLMCRFLAERISNEDTMLLMTCESCGFEDDERLPLAEDCLFPMFRRLAAFHNNFDPYAKPIYCPSQPNTDRTRMPRSAKTGRERLQEDDALFKELTPLLQWEMLHGLKEPSPELDPFLQGLRTMLRSGKIPLWFIVAGQCFLEAVHATKQVPHQALQEYRALSCAIQASASKSIDIDYESSADHDDGIVLIREIIATHVDRTLLNDPLHRFIVRELAGVERQAPPLHSLLQRSPMLCGMHAFRMLEEVHMLSIAYINRYAAVLGVAHLFNAVRQEGYSQVKWLELERMIQIQGEHFIFNGGRPATVEQYNSRYQLTLGMSAVNFATNRRSTKAVHSSEAVRVFKWDLPTSSLLRQWWSPESGKEHIGLPHLERLLNDSFEAIRQDEAMNHAHLPMPEGVPAEAVRVRRKKPQQNGRRVRKDSPQTKLLKPTELLVALATNMEREIRMLKFDYLGLHRQCWRLLNLLATRLDELIGGQYGNGWRGQEDHLAINVVMLILRTSAEDRRLARLTLRSRDAERIQHSLLAEAGKIVEDFLKELDKERKEGSVGQFDEAAFRE